MRVDVPAEMCGQADTSQCAWQLWHRIASSGEVERAGQQSHAQVHGLNAGRLSSSAKRAPRVPRALCALAGIVGKPEDHIWMELDLGGLGRRSIGTR